MLAREGCAVAAGSAQPLVRCCKVGRDGSLTCSLHVQGLSLAAHVPLQCVEPSTAWGHSRPARSRAAELRGNGKVVLRCTPQQEWGRLPISRDSLQSHRDGDALKSILFFSRRLCISP